MSKKKMPRVLRYISFSWKIHFLIFFSDISEGNFSLCHTEISLVRLSADLVFGPVRGINSASGWHGGSAPTQVPRLQLSLWINTAGWNAAANPMCVD